MKMNDSWSQYISKSGQELGRLPIPQLIVHITLACDQAKGIVPSRKQLQLHAILGGNCNL